MAIEWLRHSIWEFKFKSTGVAIKPPFSRTINVLWRWALALIKILHEFWYLYQYKYKCRTWCSFLFLVMKPIVEHFGCLSDRSRDYFYQVINWHCLGYIYLSNQTWDMVSHNSDRLKIKLSDRNMNNHRESWVFKINWILLCTKSTFTFNGNKTMQFTIWWQLTMLSINFFIQRL